jgi:hypothetical protein
MLPDKAANPRSVSLQKKTPLSGEEERGFVVETVMPFRWFRRGGGA